MRRVSSGSVDADLGKKAERALGVELEETYLVGTGYGRVTLPFSKEHIRSEILCHGLGAHMMYPETRTVLDIGGQDTKGIQIDANGIVENFQMNDRCAAGCGDPHRAPSWSGGDPRTPAWRRSSSLRARSVDEYGRPDGAPPEAVVVGNFQPTLTSTALSGLGSLNAVPPHRLRPLTRVSKTRCSSRP